MRKEKFRDFIIVGIVKRNMTNTRLSRLIICPTLSAEQPRQCPFVRLHTTPTWLVSVARFICIRSIITLMLHRAMQCRQKHNRARQNRARWLKSGREQDIEVSRARKTTRGMKRSILRTPCSTFSWPLEPTRPSQRNVLSRHQDRTFSASRVASSFSSMTYDPRTTI